MRQVEGKREFGQGGRLEEDDDDGHHDAGGGDGQEQGKGVAEPGMRPGGGAVPGAGEADPEGEGEDFSGGGEVGPTVGQVGVVVDLLLGFGRAVEGIGEVFGLNGVTDERDDGGSGEEGGGDGKDDPEDRLHVGMILDLGGSGREISVG